MKKYIIAVFVACIFMGCLKNDNFENYSGIKPIIVNPYCNFPPASIFAAPPTDSAFGVKQLNLVARYSFQNAPLKDIKVTFTRNDSLIASYNQAFRRNYVPLPDSDYTITQAQLTIPAGVMQAALPVTIYPQKFDGTSNYIIAFTITDADGFAISATTKNIVFTIKGH